MKYIATLLSIIFIAGCATNLITEEEIVGYEKACERNTTIVVEPERTVVIEACVKERVYDEIKYIRAVKEIEYIDEYYRQKILCEYRGGRMMIQRMSGFGTNKPPRKNDRYSCMHGFDKFILVY